MSNLTINNSALFTIGGNGKVTCGKSATKVYRTEHGLVYNLKTGYFNGDITYFDSNTGTVTQGISSPDFRGVSYLTGNDSNMVQYYTAELTGYFYARDTGTHGFTLKSDDASYLWIGSAAIKGQSTAQNALLQTTRALAVGFGGGPTLTDPFP